MKIFSILMSIMNVSLLMGSHHLVRKNVNSLTHKEWEEFKRGIRIMRERSARNSYDPLGFYYQANIHGWPDYDGSDRANRIADKMNWHKCQHGSYFFLIWHRMFIYFFERILQKMTKNYSLTIPYWDCYESSSRALPPPFRIPANNETNPLYVSQRCKDINDGKPFSENVVTPYQALSANFFSTFKQNNELNVCHSFGGGKTDKPEFMSDREGLLERIPHDNIHLLIGGPNGFMSDLCQAGRDPIFLVLHTQIDRIWESWIKAGGQNNMERKYFNQTFDFYDEMGERGSYRVGDFLNIRELGYTYETYIKSEPIRPIKKGNPRLYVPINQKENLIINGNKKYITLHMQPKWNHFFRLYALGQFDDLEIKFSLQFDVEYIENRIFDLYLNLNEETVPYDTQPNFLGTMVNFEVRCVPRFRRENLSISKCYDITKPLKNVLKSHYQFEGHLPHTFNLTFVPKTCDIITYPRDNREIIRFNEILIVFFRTDDNIDNNVNGYPVKHNTNKELFDKSLDFD